MDPNTLAVWKNVETRLNTSLRENMVNLVLEMARDRTTDPHKIATWMVTTSTCICYATFGNDDPEPLLSLYIRAMETQYPETMQAIYRILVDEKRTTFSPSSLNRDNFIGILWAVGSTFTNGELKLVDDKISVNTKGMQRIKSIWKAPTRTLDNSNHKTKFQINADDGEHR